jgi:hypothetical protein
MCKYCKEDSKDLIFGSVGEIYDSPSKKQNTNLEVWAKIWGDTLDICFSIGGSCISTHTEKIKFCPKCGEALKALR